MRMSAGGAMGMAGEYSNCSHATSGSMFYFVQESLNKMAGRIVSQTFPETL